jgi:hypothetical protein
VRELFCDTAILLFTRDAREESAAKKFHVEKVKNRKVTSFLINHTISISNQSGLDLIVMNQQVQRGSCFGDRLYNAFRDVFLKGYTNIIAIGNDTPSLTTDDLLAAANHLHQHNAVLGPSSDGGIYLLGITKEQFDKANLSVVSWGSSRVCQELIQIFSKINTGILFQLKQKADIDNAKDLRHILSSYQNDRFARILKKILETYKIFAERIQHTAQVLIRFSFGLKAPPVQH